MFMSAKLGVQTQKVDHDTLPTRFRREGRHIASVDLVDSAGYLLWQPVARTCRRISLEWINSRRV